MISWEQTLLGPDESLRKALAVIDSGARQMALVVDPDRRLIGTLSDGDIRRWLIGGGTIEDRAGDVCTRTPIVGHSGTGKSSWLAVMRAHGIHQLPVLDDHQAVVDFITIDDFLTVQPRSETIVIMAGGLGSRMGALTQSTPKPMLPIGDKPVLHIIIDQFKEQGFSSFCLAVNYLGNKIIDYFGDGSDHGVVISYLSENKRMGTAGALSLLAEVPEHPVIVTNGDLLLKEDFAESLDRHVRNEADLTVLVRDYQMQVPFGVVREEEGAMVEIVEKPVHTFKVNAGVYILSPSVLGLIPKDSFFDMPDLVNNCVAKGLRTSSQRIEGYWIDIGQVSDYERAQREYREIFR
jgi:dTDP-glucose pyrophosphorylase